MVTHEWIITLTLYKYQQIFMAPIWKQGSLCFR